MKIIDNLFEKNLYKFLKTYSNSGNLTTYDRSFVDILKGAGEQKDYVGAIRDAIEVHSFYFSKAKFRVYKNVNGKTEELIEHPFNQFFKRPNSISTWWEYAYKIPVYWGLWGVNYFHVKRNVITNDPIGFQQIPPSLIEKQYSIRTGVLEKYFYVDGVNKIPLNIKDIIEIKYPNPYSERDGFAIVNSVADQKTVNYLQMHYMKKFFENGGFMGLIFTTKQEMRRVNFDRTLEMLENKFKGKDKAYKEIGLFDSGLEPVKASYSIKDMDITESRKLTKEDIFQTWKVADVMVGRGTMDRAGNEAAIYQFTSGIIDPLLSFIDSSLSLFVQKEWDDGSLEIIHDTLAPKDVQAQLKYYDNMTRIGGLTINEVRAYEGENEFPYELCDVPLINVGGAIVRLDTGKQIRVENETDKTNDPNGAKRSDLREDLLVKVVGDERWLDLKWKQFNSRHGISLRRFEKTLKRYFGDQERRILEAVLNNYIVEQAFNLENENMILYQLLEIDLWDIMRDGHKFGSFQFDLGIDFNKELLITEFDKISNTTLKINDTTYESIKGLKTESELQKAYRQIKESRLDNIAITTTTGAFNAGLLQAMKDAGFNKKTWLTMRDSKVRDAHKFMDGVTVPIDEPFEVEAKGIKYLGLYPGDPILGAINNVNCRCTILGGE